MRKFFVALMLLSLIGVVSAEQLPLASTYVPFSMNGLTFTENVKSVGIKNAGTIYIPETTEHPIENTRNYVGDIYVIGNSTTVFSTYEISATSFSIHSSSGATLQGLGSSTTSFLLAAYPTMGSLFTKLNSLTMYGGVVISSRAAPGSSAYVDTGMASNKLTAVSETNCKSADSRSNLYYTGNTATICISTTTGYLYLATTGGLYPGTTAFLLSNYSTIPSLFGYLGAISTQTVGASGGVVISTTLANPSAVLSSILTSITTTSCFGFANALTLTVTPAATPTATFYISASSITVTTTGGIYPGTTGYTFADADKDTISEFVTYLNAVPPTTTGASGGFTASLPTGVYRDNATTELIVNAAGVPAGDCSVSTTVAFANTYGMSVVLDGKDLLPGYKYHLADVCANATFATGRASVIVYDGAATTTIKRKETLSLSAEDGRLDIPYSGYFWASPNTSLRIDMVGTGYLTDGYINYTGFLEK